MAAFSSALHKTAGSEDTRTWWSLK